MKIELSGTDKEYIGQILAIAADGADDQADKDRLRKIISAYENKPISGAIRNLVTQLECNLTLFESNTLWYTDLKPAVAALDKRSDILYAFKQALTGEFEFEAIYKLYTKYVIYDSRPVEVVELLSEDFGFILFKSAHSSDYYLDVLKNHSAAYWSELVKIPFKDAEELMRDGSYQKALTMLANHKKTHP